MGRAAHRQGHVLLRSAEPFPAALFWSAAALFILLASASLFLAGPQIQVDEGSYLLTAATLAGKLAVNGVNGYYSGYSFLLLPAFLLGPDPDRVYHGALVINALLVATTPFALFRLTTLLHPEMKKGLHVAAALAATTYAPLLLISQHAMSESALVPLYAWLLATGAGALFTERRSQALCCGAIAGLLLLVHPRGAAIAAPVIAVLCAFELRHVEGRRLALIIAIAALGIGALHVPLELLAGKDATLGSSYSPTNVADRMDEPATWFWIALNALGSATEAIMTSFGIFAVAACALVAGVFKSVAGPTRAVTAKTPLEFAMLLGMAAAILMSAIFFVPPLRADHIAYGRYALPAVMPMLSLGLVHLALPNTRRMVILASGMIAAVVCLALMGFAFTRLSANLTQVWNYINAPGLYLAQDFGHFHNAWSSIGLCFLVLAGALVACTWYSARAGIGLFATANLLIAAFAWVSFVRPQSLLYEEQRRIEVSAEAFEASTDARLCLSMSDALDLWQAIDLRWQIFPEIASAESKSSEACVRGVIDLVSGSGATKSGMHLIELVPSPANANLIAGLYVEPGPALETWERTHSEPAMESFEALPPSEWHADIQIRDAGKIPTRIRTGDAIEIGVVIQHAGESSRWSPFQYGDYPIRLGARVTPIDSDRTVGEYRSLLEAELHAGETGVGVIRIGPFATPGRYRARIGIVQEHVAWFAGSKDIEFEVDNP